MLYDTSTTNEKYRQFEILIIVQVERELYTSDPQTKRGHILLKSFDTKHFCIFSLFFFLFLFLKIELVQTFPHLLNQDIPNK